MLNRHRILFVLAGFAALACLFVLGCFGAEFSAVAKWRLRASSATLAAMALLGYGFLDWHREQRTASAHRFVDPLTQLADADHLRDQLRIAFERSAPRCNLLMFDIDNFHLVNRDYCRREGDRLLQAVTHTLQLNLRSTDLLCRYAGDRFAIFVPDTDADAARALADHLRRAVASLRHHTRHGGKPIQVSVRYAARTVDVDPRQLLKELNRALERRVFQASASCHLQSR